MITRPQVTLSPQNPIISQCTFLFHLVINFPRTADIDEKQASQTLKECKADKTASETRNETFGA